MPQWEQRVRSGEFKPVSKDTPQLRALKAHELALADTRRQRVLVNPYGDRGPAEKPLKRRSRLDYMRALSEVIKARRQIAEREGAAQDSMAQRLEKAWRARSSRRNRK